VALTVAAAGTAAGGALATDPGTLAAPDADAEPTAGAGRFDSDAADMAGAAIAGAAIEGTAVAPAMAGAAPIGAWVGAGRFWRYSETESEGEAPGAAGAAFGATGGVAASNCGTRFTGPVTGW
jgi:hypothetical protein